MRRAVLLSLVLGLPWACSEHPSAPSLAASSATPAASSAPVASASASAVTSASASVGPTAPAGPGLFVRARSLPIHAEASTKSRTIGTLVSGDSVALRDEAAKAGPGCASMRAVAPRGWVCEGGDATSTDPADPVWAALRQHAPDYASAWPFTYGESKGARRHKSVPGLDTPTWPASVFDGHVEIPRRSTVAWTDEVEADGTSWLRVNDQTFVRKDRVTPFDRSDFQGVKLAGDVALPLAFFKRGLHAKYARDASGKLEPTGQTYARLSWVGLTGKSEKHGAHAMWETKDDGVWIDSRDAAIVQPQGVTPDGPHPTWLEVAANQGWLVAFENDTPVFATMISGGKLGAARPDPDHEPHQPAATTPIGTWRIREKLLTATLQSDLDDGTEFVHAEVPWSQRFYDKYLLHTAYWHDQWGEGHSGGCVNLSPTDAQWLFAWTEPKLPDGWHAVKTTDEDAAATIVVIHP